MGNDFKEENEFKVGFLTEGAKRRRLEGKRQGRTSYTSGDQNDPENEPKSGNTLQLLHETVAADRARRQLAAIEEATNAALIEARRREAEAAQALEDIRQAATRTGDGRRVYRTEDGKRAFDDQGNELTPDEIAAIDWNPDGPTWEQRQDAGDKLEEAIEDREAVEDYQERIDGLSPAELDTIDLDMPDSVRERLGSSPRTTAASEYEFQGIEADSVAPAFERAALSIEAEPSAKPAPLPSRSLDI